MVHFVRLTSLAFNSAINRFPICKVLSNVYMSESRALVPNDQFEAVDERADRQLVDQNYVHSISAGTSRANSLVDLNGVAQPSARVR